MLKIGEFSRLSQVTIKALHYYDDMGLLKPASIDKFTGYRYYTVEQLPRLHSIIAFKELGLSLEQIVNLLDAQLSPVEMRDTLRQQKAEIESRIQQEQSRLAQLDFRLRMLEMEVEMPALEVIVKSLPPQRALTLRTSIGQPNIPTLLTLQTEFEQAIRQHHIKMVGPLADIHYAEEVHMDFQDVEFVFPVDESQTEDVPLETAGVLKLTTVPGLPLAATYIHHSTDENGYDTRHVSEIMPILQRWIVDNGYQLLGTIRTVRHHGPLQHAEYKDWITEFQHEIALSE